MLESVPWRHPETLDESKAGSDSASHGAGLQQCALAPLAGESTKRLLCGEVVLV